MITAIGSLSLLQSPGVALFCSNRCPGDLILKTYDLAQALREAKIPVISGFHTPVERDCFKILLQGTQPVIYCPARSIHKLRLSPEQKQAVNENRLLLLSPFDVRYSRMTAELAAKRNQFVGAIAHTVFIAYAAPNSNTLTFAQYLHKTKKFAATFSTFQNTPLYEKGISEVSINQIVQCFLHNITRVNDKNDT